MKSALDIFIQPLFQIYASFFAWLPPSVDPGMAVILFGIALNLALTPFYNHIERGLRDRRLKRERVREDVARMKRHFRGRERYFYIRAVHRQHRYHPISELAGSADLFLQVFVFITVYHFLVDLPLLNGASFGPISDLSQPDHLLLGINLLPIAMTGINAISVLAYIDEPRKRLQAISLGLLFLVLLYRSPSGMVLYWTTNNLFSLVRTVIQRRQLFRLPASLREFIGRLSLQQ